MTKMKYVTPRYSYSTGGYSSDWSQRNRFFAGCCGATFLYRTSKVIPDAGKGIKVIAQKKYDEVDNELLQIKHIKTKNGNITVLIRKKV
jgi:hypothetical protein